MASTGRETTNWLNAQSDASPSVSPPYVPLINPTVLSNAPSRFVKASMSVPVLRAIAHLISEASAKHQRSKQIARQIVARRHSTRMAWGDDPVRRAVAAMVCDTIRSVYGWPNSHFLPDDRLELLMPELCNGLLWDRQGHPSADYLAAALGQVAPNPHELTLGQLVDQLVRLPQRCRNCGYDLRASPQRCPECGTPRQFGS